jgi:hypothetical protein
MTPLEEKVEIKAGHPELVEGSVQRSVRGRAEGNFRGLRLRLSVAASTALRLLRMTFGQQRLRRWEWRRMTGF